MFSPILPFEGSVNYLIFNEIEFTRILAFIVVQCNAIMKITRLYETGQVGKYTAQSEELASWLAPLLDL